MNQDIQDLKIQVQQILQKIQMMDTFNRTHFHDGNNSQRVNFGDLMVVGPTAAAPAPVVTTVPSGGGNVSAPAQPSGVLAVQIGNITYNLLYE